LDDAKMWKRQTFGRAFLIVHLAAISTMMPAIGKGEWVTAAQANV
jgi:hypothetical protein